MTSKKEKLLHNTYENFLDLVLHDFPLDRIDEIAVNDVMGYGTTIDEKILQIEGVRELVIKQREQSKGAEMNFNIERVFQKMFSNDEAALIVDEILINMIIDGMKNVIPARVSTVLEFIDSNWKVIHWHGSVAVESEDDTWHINEWKKKNERLQKLVDEQTADLVKKNTELEIEASLERVRTVAMSMNKSDDLLKICEITFREFQKLGFNNLRNAIINILDDEKGFFMDYDYSDYLGGSINSISYNSHPIVENYLKQIKKAHDAFAEVVIEGDELDGWKEFRRKGGQLDDPKLDEISSLHYYLYSIGVGDIGISTFKPIDESQIKILKRFRNVFDLAYRRYNDIAQAEAQAREAQIETALERVRARTMAMQKSDELQDAAVLLFHQVEALGIRSFGCGFNIWEDNRKTATAWMAGKDRIQPPFKTSSSEDIFLRIYEAAQKGGQLFVEEQRDEALEAHYKYMTTISVFKEIADTMAKEGLSVPTFQIMHCAYFSQGYLMFITFEPASHAYDIFKRFAKVFEQTYTRFLDLQKAEAQAREAQIEAALERVRSKTMAMHNSKDVGDTVATLFKEVMKLGLDPSIRCGIGILEGNVGMETWSATSYPNGKIDLKTGMLDMTIHPMLIGVKKAWKNDEKGYSYEYVGDDVIKYYTALNNEPDYPFYVDLDTLPEKEYHNSFFFTEGILFSFTENPLSEESSKVLNRFAGVFGQTYRRYLDLKNAEEQNKIIQAENDRKTKELEEARELQLSMLPKELPQLPNLDIAVYMQTATEVGGDYYDFHVAEDGTLTAVLGDATGHGMKAGTMVTITKSLFDTFAASDDIIATFNQTSKVIKGLKFRQISMCLLMLKLKGNKLKLSSAAMPPALIYRKKIKTVEEIFMKGMPLGSMNNFPYEIRETTLNKGDTILLLSDGLPELSNDNEEMYGYDRTKSVFQSVGKKEPEEIVNHLKNSASKWVNGKAPDDDVTFVVLKMK